MLYHTTFYRKCLLFGICKHLTYGFYHTGKFMPGNFEKLQKLSLGFVVTGIEIYMSVTQK